MSVESFADQEAAAFGRYGHSVRQADLVRFFVLDDGDRKLVGAEVITIGCASALS